MATVCEPVGATLRCPTCRRVVTELVTHGGGRICQACLNDALEYETQHEGAQRPSSLPAVLSSIRCPRCRSRVPSLQHTPDGPVCGDCAESMGFGVDDAPVDALVDDGEIADTRLASHTIITGSARCPECGTLVTELVKCSDCTLCIACFFFRERQHRRVVDAEITHVPDAEKLPRQVSALQTLWKWLEGGAV